MYKKFMFIFNVIFFGFSVVYFNVVFCSYGFNKKHFHQDFLSYSSSVNKAALSVVSIQTTEKILHDSYFIFSDTFFQYVFIGANNIADELFNNNINVNDYTYNNDISSFNNSNFLFFKKDFFSSNFINNFEKEPEKESDKEIDKNENFDMNDFYQHGLGSGVLINNNGYILTNYHVVKDSCFIIVKLYDGKESEVDIIGFDTKTDLAVLKILDKNLIFDLPIIEIGNSCSLEVGDVVLAIGNPFGFDNTVTQGIVSALGSVKFRTSDSEIPFIGLLDNLIQTDAAINPGNSGGALIDLCGNLIGVNMAIISKSGGSHGLGFAIPIDIAKTIVHQLIDEGQAERGWLGVYLAELTWDILELINYNKNIGVYIHAVISESPASKVGIYPGDIIFKINGKFIKNTYEAVQNIIKLKPGDICLLDIYRNGEYLSFLVNLGSGVDS
ncbi:MAG: trypsin-like peptidase domain-containing protein [Candidatus Azosocius agrarius]|nr:MAG: trypsin-like peptidase domain-containing protein [Gammaproteobacteria bacterium]